MEHVRRTPVSQPSFVLSELKRTDLFSVLSEDDQQKVFEKTKIFVSKKNDVIVNQGYSADYIFFVATGCVRKARIDPAGRRIIAGFAFGSDFSPVSGDFVGASVTKEYPYSIEAIGETVLCRFRRKDLLESSRGYHALEDRLFDLVADEYLRKQAHLDIVMDGPAHTRLARFLLYIAQRIGQPVEGKTSIILGMSRQDIADHIAHSVESISRAFTKLRNAGLIAYLDGQSSRLLVDEAGLRQLAYLPK